MKLTRFIGVSVVGLMMAQIAAAEETTVNLSTDALSLNVSGSARMEMVRSDNGLGKTDTVTPDTTEVLQFTAAFLKFDGRINKDVEYLLNLNVTDDAALDTAEVTWWATKMFGLSFGKSLVYQGGYEGLEADPVYDHFFSSIYAANFMVFDATAPAMGLHLNLKGIGKAALQIVNDKVTPENTNDTGLVEASWNKRAHTTWILHYEGAFGPIAPLLNIGSWDNNKSRYIDLGIRAEMAGLVATLDYSTSSIVEKSLKAGETAEYTWTASNYNLGVSYTVKKKVRPAFFYSSTTVDHGKDDDMGKTEWKYNATDSDSGEMFWNQNGTVVGLSANFIMFGNGFEPFLAYTQRSGDWLKAGTTDTADTKSETQIKLGAIGYF